VDPAQLIFHPLHFLVQIIPLIGHHTDLQVEVRLLGFVILHFLLANSSEMRLVSVSCMMHCRRAALISSRRLTIAWVLLCSWRSSAIKSARFILAILLFRGIASSSSPKKSSIVF